MAKYDPVDAHNKRAMTRIARLYREGINGGFMGLVDMSVIDAQGGKTYAHRLVLTATYEHLQKLLDASAYCGPSKKPGQLDVDLKKLRPDFGNVSPFSVKAFVDHAYCGRTDMDDIENALADSIFLFVAFGVDRSVCETLMARMTVEIAGIIVVVLVANKSLNHD